MKPVRVSVDVPTAREAVYDFLDVMANHERFTDHFLTDWECSGPARGVGSRARVRARAGGRSEAIDIEVVSAEPPARNVEHGTSSGGRRLTTGTYLLEPLPDGGTRVTFELAWRRAPLTERLAAPLVRAFVRRENARALQRLAERLAAADPEARPAVARG